MNDNKETEKNELMIKDEYTDGIIKILNNLIGNILGKDYYLESPLGGLQAFEIASDKIKEKYNNLIKEYKRIHKVAANWRMCAILMFVFRVIEVIISLIMK